MRIKALGYLVIDAVRSYTKVLTNCVSWLSMLNGMRLPLDEQRSVSPEIRP